MEFILQLLITPVVLWMAQKWINGVYFKDKAAAIWTSVLIIVIGFLIGWLLHFVLNLATLGLLSLIGLGVVIRIVANAIIIELIDRFRDDFETRGLLPSLWLAVLLAVAWGIIDLIF